jgi:hypothetical protein
MRTLIVVVQARYAFVITAAALRHVPATPHRLEADLCRLGLWGDDDRHLRGLPAFGFRGPPKSSELHPP